MNSELLNIDQVAEMLEISKRTLYLMRSQGRGPRAVKLGRELKYRRRDVQMYLDSLFAAEGVE